MSKWHSLLEILQFPLKMLFIGTLLLGIGTAVLNPNVTFLWQIDHPVLIQVFELLRYMGASIIYFFPFLVFIHILSHRYESSMLVMIGVLSYVVIHISMVFFLNPSLPSYFYQSIFNVTEIDFTQMSGNLSSIRLPYQLGIFGYILAYAVTHFCYIRSRKYSIFGITSFVDHDTMAGVMTLILSVLCGIGVAYVWPLATDVMNSFFEVIASDISNPVNLLLYGMYERISAVLGFLDIPRQIFWFSDMGGSWLNNVGLKFSGDVAIWTAQRQAGMSTMTSGTFITPYYVINLFIMPAFYLAYYRLCSNIEDKKRYLGFFIIAFLLTILCGNPLPAEIMMLILSPMLYLIYIVIVGLLYAFLQMFHVVVGYNFSELLMLANPGSGLDLLEYLRNPYIAYNVYKLLAVGLIVAVIFYFLTRIYFKKYALGLFQMVDKDKICEDIVENLGGLDNIIEAHSTPDKLTIKFVNREMVDYDSLRKKGAYLLLESRNGYLIRIGNISTMIKDYIVRMKKESIQEFPRVQNETKNDETSE
ncbi:hypothetical protein [Traorella massiliensis]|uniref:hypothetical protein n=1 Tax=Traorella massiliensis TaxID=1903263 RepID=UPI002354B1F7|nr:hypothetical protein [Traorella massiliensis]